MPESSRRRWLSVAALAALMALAGGTAGCAGGAARALPASGPAPGEVAEVAPGVFMRRGHPGEIDGSDGRVGNAGFIVGPTGVIVVDTGTSYRDGQAMIDAVARVTPKPIHHVLLTQARQEFLFGGAAFRERGIPIHMHRDAARLMAARCEGCLRTLKRVLGADVMAGTTMFKPDVVFDADMTDRSIGRPVRLLVPPQAASPGNLAVFDEQTGTLFAGALVDHERIPDVQDADLAGWRLALAQLSMLPLRRIVPGHGPLAPAAAVGQVDRYLVELPARLAGLLRDGVALSDVADAAELPAFSRWDQYDVVHRRNASIVFLQLERAQMNAGSSASEAVSGPSRRP